jgi:hypothetical protein
LKKEEGADVIVLTDICKDISKKTGATYIKPLSGKKNTVSTIRNRSEVCDLK